MTKILGYFINFIAIIIAVTFFEYLKALISTLQGDTRPKARKRLTLNPIAHFEPIGFIIFFFTGYGWGNPVPTSSVNYSDKKRGTVITYGLPIVICIAVGITIRLLLFVFEGPLSSVGIIYTFLYTVEKYIVSIGVFNILPVYPMSGSWILKCFLKPNQAVKFTQNEKLIQLVVIFLLLMGILGRVLDIIVNFIV